jgi:hypothetical protein
MSLLDRFDRWTIDWAREVDIGHLSRQKRTELSDCNRRCSVSWHCSYLSQHFLLHSGFASAGSGKISKIS